MKSESVYLAALIIEALVLVAIAIVLTAVASSRLPEVDPSLGLLWLTMLHPRSISALTFGA